MNSTRRILNRSGFTLIEIVIVIAIAALILAAILIFVPQAQVAQRDGQRKSDVAKVLSKLDECEANNSGVACTSAATFTANYLSGINPPGLSSSYGVTYKAGASSGPGNNAACDTATTGTVEVYTNATNVQAVTICLEATGKTYQVGKN